MIAEIMRHNAGEIVELAIRRQNVNISELSRQLCVNRKTLYNWFRKKKLHTDMIIEIGKVINYDFSQDFEGELVCLGPERELNCKNDIHPDSSNSVRFWMRKYIALLEAYKELAQKEGVQKG